MKRSEVLAVVVGTILLAVAIVRLAIPDRSRLRALSVEAIRIASEPIKHDQSLERTFEWLPPEDVYIVGWGPRANAKNSGAEMTLFMPGPPPMLLFDYAEDGRPSRNEYAAPGTGFLVKKGAPVKLRFRVNNGGPDSQTLGGVALIYFVPAAGN
jgi:hypothetical protein